MLDHGLGRSVFKFFGLLKLTDVLIFLQHELEALKDLIHGRTQVQIKQAILMRVEVKLGLVVDYACSVLEQEGQLLFQFVLNIGLIKCCRCNKLV